MENFIPVNRPLISNANREAVESCLMSGWVSSEGPYVQTFEKEFSSYIGHKYGVAVSNGTAALEIAVKALGVGIGDEVILPSHTIISCAQAVVKAGATPVLIDSEPTFWNMDASKVEAAITEKTKAVMVVHLFGFPVDMERILELCNKRGIWIIEDTAQMVGQTYYGKKCGSFGDISTFSFYPNKMITTGEGGMCTTSNPDLADKCRYYTNLCFEPGERFHHNELGWNYRMTSMQAALGSSQLKSIEQHIQRKRQIGAIYWERLSEQDLFELPRQSDSCANNIFWVFGVIVKPNPKGLVARDIIAKLSHNSVGARPFFFPMHRQEVFKKSGIFSEQSFPVADHLHTNGFYLPSGLGNTDDEIFCASDTLMKLAASL